MSCRQQLSLLIEHLQSLSTVLRLEMSHRFNAGASIIFGGMPFAFCKLAYLIEVDEGTS